MRAVSRIEIKVMGRQTTFTQAKADNICAGLREGKSLRAICRELELNHAMVLDWVKEWPEFGDQYARAREVGYTLLAEELVEIADEENVTVRRPPGAPRKGDESEDEVEVVFDSTAVARNRLRVDTRKWMLSKMLPKVYGDKLETTLQGANGGPIETKSTVTLTAEDAYKRMLG